MPTLLPEPPPCPLVEPGPPTIAEAEAVWMEGHLGQRYLIHQPNCLTGVLELDRPLNTFPVLVFRPAGRPPAETPLVIGVQGLSAPLQWNAFLIPTLLDRGIAVALLDAPLGGERTLARTFRGSLPMELVPLLQAGVPFGTWFLPRVMETFAANLLLTRQLLGEREGLTDPRLALFGVSMGVLLASYAFFRHQLGQRFLGAIGHADLSRFADSFLQGVYGIGNLAKIAANTTWGRDTFHWNAESAPLISAWICLLRLLDRLRLNDQYTQLANPMAYALELNASRPVRFLVGEDDPHVNLADVKHVCARLPNADFYPVPGLEHGPCRDGRTFAEHAAYFVTTQLSDWCR